MNFKGAKSKQYLFLAVMIVVIMIAYFLRSPIYFRQTSPDKEIAEYEQNGKKYMIEKVFQEGSGQYTVFTILRLEGTLEPVKIGEFVTCGRYKVQDNRIFFFEPRGFKCGLLTSWWDDMTNPKTSVLEFKPDSENIYRISQ